MTFIKTQFEANFIDYQGKKAVELLFRLGDFDFYPRRILLIINTPMLEYDRLPFTWQFIEESLERRYPIIRIVAGPGVSILANKIQLEVFSNGFPLIQIYRVQDYFVIPPIGTDISAINLVGSYNINAKNLQYAMDSTRFRERLFSFPNNYLSVERLPDGVNIQHPASTIDLVIRVPLYNGKNEESRDFQARFAYEIETGNEFQEHHPVKVKIVKTPAVEFAVARPTLFGINLSGSGISWEVWEVDKIEEVPPQGTPIQPTESWRPIRSWPTRNRKDDTLGRAIIDIGIGFIPVVGDLADIAELFYGIHTGKDKWGEPLTSEDLYLMGMAAILPFVSTGIVKTGRKLSKHLIHRFGDHANEAANLIERVQEIGLNQDERNLIQNMEDLIQKGSRATSEMWEKYIEILKRINAEPPSVDDLLNADKNGFLHVDLQEAYQNHKKKKGDKALPPDQWAFSQKTSTAREIFEKILGPNYAKRKSNKAKKLIRWVNTPRPTDYTDELLKEHMELVLKEEKQIFKKLDKIFEKYPDVFKNQKQINFGDMINLKGIVGEILSIPKQLEILSKVQQKWPNARLISNVFVKTPSSNGPKQFSDNIIAIIKENHLEVVGVIEVKSGYKGGQEATVQIFEWIENKLDDGGNLIIPKDSIVRNAKGEVHHIEEKLVYTIRSLDINDVPEKVVTGLSSNGQRYIITAKGKSHLGLDSADQIAKKPEREELPLSSEMLDYLLTQILERYLSGKV